MLYRVAVSGFLHETQNFSPVLTERRNFESSSFWPGLRRCSAMLDTIAGLSISVTGADETLQEDGVKVVPTTCVSLLRAEKLPLRRSPLMELPLGALP
jgi:microcystin degradation protein MlrC